VVGRSGRAIWRGSLEEQGGVREAARTASEFREFVMGRYTFERRIFGTLWINILLWAETQSETLAVGMPIDRAPICRLVFAEAGIIQLPFHPHIEGEIRLERPISELTANETA
jgi:hypothetical protein